MGVYYMYNIKVFGNYIKTLREGLNLTRKDLNVIFKSSLVKNSDYKFKKEIF